MKILIVEDDEMTAKALTAVLSRQQYAVEVASDGQAGLALVEAFAYDLVVLDVTLPKLDGITLCKQLRSNNYQMPILLLTAHNSSHDKAIGLDAGADDYLVKPFEAEELVARIRALLRRSGLTSQPILEWERLRLNPTSCEVTYADLPLSLTPKEYALLELFLRNRQRVFSCDAILEHLWTFEDTPGGEAVRTHIKGLRQKLKLVNAPVDLIETVYGIGYRLKPLEQLEKKAANSAKDNFAKEKDSPEKDNLIKDTLVKNNLEKDNSTTDKSIEKHQIEAESTAKALQQQTLAAIADVWKRFQPRVQEQLSVLEQAAQASLQQTLESALRQQAEQEAHTLAGSLGTFGFEDGSNLARKIETLLRSEKRLSQQKATQLHQAVTALQQTIGQSITQNTTQNITQNITQNTTQNITQDTNQDTNQKISDRTLITPPKKTSELLGDRPFVLGVSEDQQLAEQLLQESTSWNVRIEITADLSSARTIIDRDRPNAVLLDLTISSTREENLALLAELNQKIPSIPVIVFAAESQLSDRLTVARLGGQAFLHKPLTAEQIFAEVSRILQRVQTTEARVMIVDDDPQILDTLKTLLVPWGLHITTLDDPSQFWQVLEAASPNLLILDIKMPQINGIELCQVVRNDPRWSGLPILFLTAYTDAATVNQVFAAGADDFISKPIVGPELVTRIINRLERIKLLKNLAELDPLTKVLNRQKSTQEFDALLQRAEQHQQPLCLAVLNLDHLKQMNYRYGDAVGDSLLRQLGQILRRSFQGNDVVARWSGEEFAIGMYGMTKQEGEQRLIQILDIFRKEQLASDGNYAQVTFSAGIAQYPDDGTHLQALYRVADMALSQAKTTGGDRIILAEKTPVPIEELRKAKDELEIRVAERTAELISVNQRLRSELNERQRIEKELRVSQARFAGILEIADDAVISVDANQRITLFNQGAEKIFGYTAQEAIGQRLDLLLPARFIAAHRHHVAGFAESSGKARRMGERGEIVGCRKNGEEFPAEASISKLELGNEKVFTVILRDVSARKVVERMKNEFISVVSHELRTPLTSIHGSLGMLASGLLDAEPETGKRLLEIAVDSTERLVRLINDVLDVERIESGKVTMVKQWCNAANLMTNATEVMQAMAEKFGVTLSVSPLAVSLWADPDRIVQTLTNLLSNAIKFSPHGSTVWLGAELQNQEVSPSQHSSGSQHLSESQLLPNSQLPPIQVLFHVRDRGRGIPVDKLETIFERFQQVDASDSRNHDGTGLGLAICRSIVQQHSGQIWVESVLGEGSTFYFTLPLSENDAALNEG